MTKTFIAAIISVAGWLLLFPAVVTAGPVTDSLPAASPGMPNDPAVLTGQLPNGFRYFIRKNGQPAQRAVLYLVNKSGSLQETEAQRGLAHFTEHMAFKGTKHFPQNELVSYLQHAGIKLGADLNAYTSFEETVYQLPIPTDDPQLLSNGLRILRDWAGDVSFGAGEIDTERGVILEERRQRKGLQQRIQDQSLPVLLNGARYTHRSPIGLEEVLKHFPHAQLRKYYQDWYRPDLQAIVAVGDLDPIQVEAQIRQLFGNLRKPGKAPAHPDNSIVLKGQQQYTIVADEEITQTTIEIFNKYSTKPSHTEKSLLQGLSLQLFNTMLAGRLQELQQQGTPPFLAASANINTIFKGLGAAKVSVTVLPGDAARSVKAVMAAIKRIQQHGFTVSEFNRARSVFRQNQAARYREKDKTPSQQYVNRYVQAFLHDAPYPSDDYYYQFYTKYIDSIKLPEVNAWVNRFYKTENQDIFILSPAKDSAGAPSGATIKAWLQQAADSSLAPYTDLTNTQPLLPLLPAPGIISKEEKLPAVGATLLTFGNGLRVMLKPTTYKQDEIIITSFSPGGSSLYGFDDHPSAINAAGVVAQSGLGDFDAVSLPKKLADQAVQVSPYINDYFEGLQARSSKKDLVTALQLTYLYFTAPRLDTALVYGLLRKSANNVQYRYQQPAKVFADTVNAIVNGYHWRRKAPNVTDITRISAERGYAIFRERFANAGDFTFVITGSFDVDSIKPLLLQYLGSLPATGQREQWNDIGIKLPTGQLTKVVKAGKEDKATVQLTIMGEFTATEETELYMEALEAVLTYRLTNRLRGKESGVYSPSVSIAQARLPRASYSIHVSFTCDPVRAEALAAIAQEEMKLLADKGATADELQQFVAEYKRKVEVGQQSNDYWNNILRISLQLEEPPSRHLPHSALINAVNPQQFRLYASKYLNLANLMQFMLLPAQ